MKHTCATTGRAACEPCTLLEIDLWDAINQYTVAVGGDPGKHVYGNEARMRAVANVGEIVDRVTARQRIDDLTVEDLAKSSNAAAAAACARSTEIERLLAALREVRVFLHSVARRPKLDRITKDLLDEAAAIDRVLGGKEMW